MRVRKPFVISGAADRTLQAPEPIPGEDFDEYALRRCVTEYGGAAGTMFERFIYRHRFPDGELHEQLTTIRYKSIGHWLEDWWRAQHGLPPRSDAQKNLRGLPDAILKGVPHSLKCVINPMHTLTFTRTTLNPEVTYAQQHHVGVVVVVYNLWYRQEQVFRYASADTVPNTVTVRYNDPTGRPIHRRRTRAEMDAARGGNPPWG